MESWATTYLQIACGLFFFGLGVPAYVFQTLVADEVKRAVRRNKILESEMIGLAVVYLSAVFILIWYVPGKNVSHENYQILAQALLSLMIFLTACFWIYLAVRPIFDIFLQEVASSIVRQIGWSPSVPPSPLSELISVGRITSEGEDRRAVLNSLAEIASIVQSRSGYRGNALGMLIEGVELICVRETRVSDDETAVEGYRLLFSIVKNAEMHGWDENSDIHNALLSMRKIAIATLRGGALNAGFMFLNMLAEVRSEEAAHGIFEVGRMAFVERQLLLSIQAINLLEGRINGLSRGSTALAGYLGLVAHWWSRGGECQREASCRVARVWSEEMTILLSHISYASDFFLDMLDLETVEMLGCVVVKVD